MKGGREAGREGGRVREVGLTEPCNPIILACTGSAMSFLLMDVST